MSVAEKSVAELMSQPVIEIDPETRVGDVMELAKARGVHHFPIVKRGALQGLVCTCDLGRARPETSVQQLAHNPVTTIEPSRPLREAAELMRATGSGSVVVTRDGQICGMLTRRDLIQASAAFGELLTAQVCVVCKKPYHLRKTSGGACLCDACESRVIQRGWSGVGASD